MKPRYPHAFREWRRPRRHYSKKIEQNWIIRFRVMDFWSYSKSLLWTSSSWQLRQNLWCHWGQLSIGLICTEIFTFFLFSLKIIFPVVYFFSMSLLHHFCIISERMRNIAPLTVCKNEILWTSLYITNGELSTMTSQILAELPTWGCPQ